MRLCLLTSLVIALLFSTLAPLMAQPAPAKPGPEMDVLKMMVGKWKAAVEMPGAAGKEPEKSTAKAEYELTLGGLWVEEDYEGQIAGKRFEGRCFYSYDQASKKYVSVWLDSTSTTAMTCEGSYDAAKKTLTLTGKMPCPDGKTVTCTNTVVFKDAKTMVFTMSGPDKDGKESTMMAITYTKRGRK